MLIFSLICKILLAYFVPVFGDEAYYYIWSLHPQLSYFDHPAMVSWFIWAGHLFLPTGNPISLRIMFIVAGFLVSLAWVQILRLKNFNDENIFWYLVLLLLNPLLGIGSILATPDTPLVLFWTLSYLCYVRIIQSSQLRWYTLLGVFLGLGFCSKYHIVLFVLAGLIYLIISKKILSLRPGGILLTLITGFICSLPVIVWNYNNEWSSFLFQINHGFGETQFEWAWPMGYLVAQFLIINPFIAVNLFKRSVHLVDKTFSITQLGFFFVSSFKSVVEGNWPLTSHLHSAAHFISVSSKKYFKAAAIYWIGFYILMGVFFLLPQSQKVRKNLINSAQFTEVEPLVDEYQPLYGPSYQVASLLTWKTGRAVPKLNELSRHDFYDSLPESTPTATQFYALKNDYSDWPGKYAKYKKTKIRSFDNSGLELYQFTYE